MNLLLLLTLWKLSGVRIVSGYMTEWMITVAESIGGLFVYAKTAIAAMEKGKAMAEYIERETAIDAIMSEPTDTHYPSWYADKIESISVADVVPVRHGRWIHTDYAIHWAAKDECSECTYHTCDRDDLSEYNYCPNCGSKMDEE